MQVLVIGGGVAGLAAALSLSRAGHRVRIAERDATPLPASPVDAFEHWDRSGAPQVWHSHAFLARLRGGLVARAPDVMQALHEHGAYDLRFQDYLPPTLTDRTPAPGDEDLTLFACRRITFEWVLRRCVEASPAVSWHGGVAAQGLVAERDAATGLPRVVGARVATPSGDAVWPADLVVDASGRRSRLPKWLAALGCAPVEQEEEECGIFYCSRFYRLLPGAAPPERQGVVGADLGYMKFGIFPGDGGIFSITLAAPLSDDPLRAILHEAPFEAAARAFPATREWVDPARSAPVTPVRAMAKLVNRRRRFVVDGRPLALGVAALGDAAICSNPLYGRGCALAFVHAWELESAIAASGGDLERLALAFDEGTRREIEPWYRAARDQDREAREIAEAQARGESLDAAVSSEPGKVIDPKAFMRSVFRDGLLPALRTDIQVVRAFMRAFNLLAPPDLLMKDPNLVGRVLAAWRERDQRAPAEAQGPERSEMVALLGRAA
ncbi:MAG: FAD-dependent oxidoreductase [Proteobacteria bacterium]|nr:MAG: FAD-dependent oxidoreductase [Pseudomonadota bacterium]